MWNFLARTDSLKMAPSKKGVSMITGHIIIILLFSWTKLVYLCLLQNLPGKESGHTKRGWGFVLVLCSSSFMHKFKYLLEKDAYIINLVLLTTPFVLNCRRSHLRASMLVLPWLWRVVNTAWDTDRPWKPWEWEKPSLSSSLTTLLPWGKVQTQFIFSSKCVWLYLKCVCNGC